MCSRDVDGDTGRKRAREREESSEQNRMTDQTSEIENERKRDRLVVGSSPEKRCKSRVR